SPNGFVYFANHQGLLEFDGTTWNLYRLPNETVLRAVQVQNDSVIYTSGYMELGYWKSDRFGKLHYFSLYEKAKHYLFKNTEFWNIAIADSFVYFQSFNQILTYHADSVSVVDLPPFISVMKKVNNRLLVAQRNVGIYEIVGGTVKPFLKGDFFNNKLVQFLIPFKDNQLLIGTASHGIFVWNGNEILPWNKDWTDYFIKNELNRGFYSKNGHIIIGTIIDGIAVFDETGTLLMKTNAQNGLPNNTVLGIEADEWQNLWLALDDGIGFIRQNHTKGFSIENIPEVGAIYTMTVFNENLYLGTNQGLFVRPLKAGSKNFMLVPETQGQIWDCKVIDRKLWVGHNSGTFTVQGSRALQIFDQAGGFSIKPDLKHSDLLIQSTYNDLVVYKKNGDSYNFRNRISGFSDLIRFIEIDHLGNIWASHLHRGIFKITTDDNRDKVIDVKSYGEEIFKKNLSANVFKVENRIVFTTGNQIFTYDDLKDTIVIFPSLNLALGEFASSHRIIEAPNHHYWFISKKSIGLFSIQQDKVTLIKEFPVSLFKNPPLVDGFENIFPTSERTSLLCLQNGIATLDASESDADKSITNFKPVLRQLELSSTRDKIIPLPLNSSQIKIKNKFNNIYIRISFPHYSDLPVSYIYHLEGLNSGWTVPGNETSFRFERLPAGDYTLKVKAVDSWGNESRIYTLSFGILPAWYASTPAIIFYMIALIVILLLFRRWGIRLTKRKEMQQHEIREKELIRLRNAKLREEVEHKSKELANSTMSIIKKNELLMELKEIIEKQKVELGSRYPDKYYNYLNKKIDENISNQDDWQIFQNNFERAHEQFFTKMKSKFPQLTQSDLRLCAYLRMNLSSKEIAPLLGISFRGVENHRYRLRKKMNLEHDESL
ncbi:MAG TPA: triple tyrosine motif-containing protein, partial [Draconibacterium sp.]|nr:triple tyrosine motif-containing protein [Draconibacterium sp.]